jgi:ATP-dependent helicase Lhr and Lhr-like helicase
MREVLAGDEPVTFLDPVAEHALAEARAHYERFDLDHQQSMAFEGGVVLWPWRGTRVMETLLWMLRAADCDLTEGQLAIHVKGRGINEVSDLLRTSAKRLRETVREGLGRVEAKLLWREKFEYCVPNELLAEEIIEDHLDIAGVSESIGQLLTGQ